MYRIMKERGEWIKKRFRVRYIAYAVGVSPSYLSLVLSGKRCCSKSLAYCIVKTVDKESEIRDYFLRTNENAKSNEEA